jgi:hypothetical protein
MSAIQTDPGILKLDSAGLCRDRTTGSRAIGRHPIRGLRFDLLDAEILALDPETVIAT